MWANLPNADLKESFLASDLYVHHQWATDSHWEFQQTGFNLDHEFFNAKKVVFIWTKNTKLCINCYSKEEVYYWCTASGGFIFLQWCMLVHCILFFFYGGVRKPMQYSVDKVYTEINQMLDVWILSAVTVSCVKKTNTQKKCLHILLHASCCTLMVGNVHIQWQL